jgi:hypothetical protein
LRGVKKKKEKTSKAKQSARLGFFLSTGHLCLFKKSDVRPQRFKLIMTFELSSVLQTLEL